MRNLATVSSVEPTILIFCTFEWSSTQFVLQWDQWIQDGLFFLLLFITFRTYVWMSIIPYPCSFFVALHLEWSLNISIYKKSNAICIFANLCSTLFSLWFKFSWVWFYFLLKCKKEREKRLNGKNWNVRSTVLQRCNPHFLEGVGAVPILRKNCNPFALNISLSNDQMKIFIYSAYPFLLQPPFLPT